jgi:hypothetical protein
VMFVPSQTFFETQGRMLGECTSPALLRRSSREVTDYPQIRQRQAPRFQFPVTIKRSISVNNFEIASCGSTRTNVSMGTLEDQRQGTMWVVMGVCGCGKRYRTQCFLIVLFLANGIYVFIYACRAKVFIRAFMRCCAS